MRKAVGGTWSVPEERILPALIIVSASFLLGGLAGCLMSTFVGGAGQESLRAYLESFLSMAQNGGAAAPALTVQLWDILRWPVLALLLGFTALGVLGMPLLFAVRGFLLAFSIAAFVRIFGSAGCLLAFLIFGVSGGFSVPALFVLGVQGLGAARTLASRFLGEGKAPSPYGRAYFLRCGGCAAALCVCVVLERFAVPALVSGAAGMILGG
ncbi:hypothetical protein [Intestinimonas massiliensis (ex Afouda et al. 2020)]|uniref:hypothetical protein n=1 Tax=Intestinimonas massiliensis (ex Afouda et al. 2020) TaxID=1673721 RepID=UPI00103080F1|nr:hypothetical protein [Intestinimonas massiliensis (ex Afouda et al. 2020)]